VRKFLPAKQLINMIFKIQVNIIIISKNNPYTAKNNSYLYFF